MIFSNWMTAAYRGQREQFLSDAKQSFMNTMWLWRASCWLWDAQILLPLPSSCPPPPHLLPSSSPPPPPLVSLLEILMLERHSLTHWSCSKRRKVSYAIYKILQSIAQKGNVIVQVELVSLNEGSLLKIQLWIKAWACVVWMRINKMKKSTGWKNTFLLALRDEVKSRTIFWRTLGCQN